MNKQILNIKAESHYTQAVVSSTYILPKDVIELINELVNEEGHDLYAEELDGAFDDVKAKFTIDEVEKAVFYDFESNYFDEQFVTYLEEISNDIDDDIITDDELTDVQKSYFGNRYLTNMVDMEAHRLAWVETFNKEGYKDYQKDNFEPHQLHDNVSGEILVFDDLDELRNYADLWCDRLNEESYSLDGSMPYNTKSLENIAEVFEVCNIELSKIK